MDVRSTKAYQLFLSQLDQYRQKTAALIDRLPLSAEAARELSEEYHMLKGSAGIFRFDQLAEAAADLEQSLKHAEIQNQNELVKASAEKLNQQIEQVKKETTAA